MEPYVYSQMIAGKDAYKPGEAKNSWLTGTASWNYFAITQYILGIRPEYDGLLIDPCIPSSWRKFRVKRRFRGAIYDIVINNPKGKMKGVKQIIVNGEKLEGSFIPAMLAGSTYKVEVIM